MRDLQQTPTETTGPSADEIKASCAAFYQSAWARLLLGGSLHPGGLRLTQRLGQLLALHRGHRVLDVAAGDGASALLLSQRFGCRVVGLDYSAELVKRGNRRAARAALGHRARFHRGDAERLPFRDASFDAVICECAFCTFANKSSAAAEFARVLRPGGTLGLADLTRTGTLPDELQSLLAWVACLADARPVDDYLAYLQAAGFARFQVEGHDQALAELVRGVRARLLGAELLVKLGRLGLPRLDFGEAKRLARVASDAVEQRRLGYTLLVAQRV